MPTDLRILDLVQNAKIRVGLFPSFFYSKAASAGELSGLGIEIATALAARIGVKLVLLEYPNPPGVVQALIADECDVAFLGLDPSRAAQIDFTLPYMKADFTLLVPPGSSIGSIDDALKRSARIAVVHNHAMEIAMKGKLDSAKRIPAATPDAAFALLRSHDADVLAGIRPEL